MLYVAVRYEGQDTVCSLFGARLTAVLPYAIVSLFNARLTAVLPYASASLFDARLTAVLAYASVPHPIKILHVSH